MGTPDVQDGEGIVRFALAYAALGWPVLPVKPGSKMPLGHLVPHGWVDAVTDEATIRRWWTIEPAASVGVALAPAGLMAIDVDPRNGGDLDALPISTADTLVAKTGGGGQHVLYRVPEGYEPIKCPWVGVDIKYRGYIIVEPSRHPDGPMYVWDDWVVGEGPPTIAPAPLALLQRVGEQAEVASFGSEPIGEHQLAELRATLATIPADDRGVWIAVGHACASIQNDGVGFQVWDDWSQRSARYDARDARRVWASFAGTRSHYLWVFKHAEALGGRNVMISTEAAPEPSHEIDLAALDAEDVPDPAFIVPDWLPCGAVTLMAGHGGSGKSFMAMVIAVRAALGLSVLGHDLGGQCRRVMFVSAEDNAAVLKKRIKRICAWLGVPVQRLAGWLRVLDWTERASSVLFSEERMNVASTTPVYELLAGEVRAAAPDLLVLDNSSLLYAANENARPLVQQFVGALRRLGHSEMATLLLHHVDKASTQGVSAGKTEGYSGSTGWHNSVRARWYVSGDGEARMLALRKSNYGRAGMELAWVWDEQARVLRPEGEVMTKAERVDTERIERAHTVMRAIVRYMGESPDPFLAAAATARAENGNAGARLAGLLGWHGEGGQKAARTFLMWLEAHGYIEVATVRRGNRQVACWQTTGKGTAWARLDDPHITHIPST